MTTSPLIQIESEDGPVDFGTGLEPGWARVVVPVDGVDDRTAIRGLGDVDLVRVTAFSPLPGVELPAANGPVRLDPGDLCPTP